MNVVVLICTIALGGIALSQLWRATVLMRVAKNQAVALAFAERFILDASPRLIPVSEARRATTFMQEVARHGLPRMIPPRKP